MKKRIAFIIPYFGHFNKYFPLYLKSCETNRDLCDWIIFTDDNTEYAYPENVKVHYTSFETMQNLIWSKLGKSCKCDKPYKLCDYRAAYGYLFDDYLGDYEYWGHCDSDLIWGRISHFLSDEILSSYDKIFDLGHCTIYRNTEKISRAFMFPLNGRKRYLEVYENEDNCSFDEEYDDSINNIFIEHGMKIYDDSFAANTYTKSSNFLLTKLNADKKTYSKEKRKNSVFVWDNGRLYRYVLVSGHLKRKEYMYIHFQSRPMKMDAEVLEKSTFKIIPNSFELLEEKIKDVDSFGRIKKKHFNLHYFRLRFKNLKIKMRRKMGKR